MIDRQDMKDKDAMMKPSPVITQVNGIFNVISLPGLEEALKSLEEAQHD